MQPGYPGSGQDPYGQQPPYSDPYAQPQYSPQQPQPPQPPPPPQPSDPYGQQPPQQPYQYPAAGYGAPIGGPQQNNTMGLLSLILGIISIPAACCAALGILLGAAALVLGILGMNKVKTGEASNRGQALAGIICGSIGLAVSLISAIAGATMGFWNS